MSTAFDPATLSPDDLAAAAAEKRRRDREARDTLLAALPDMDDATLRQTVADYEREHGLDEHECAWAAERGDCDHHQWEGSRCVACAGRAILARRRHEAEKRLPGANTGNSSFSGTPSEFQVGDMVRREIAPGSDRFEHVEAITIRNLDTATPEGHTIEVTWRRTNDPTADEFTATYAPSEHIGGISRIHPRTKVKR